MMIKKILGRKNIKVNISIVGGSNSVMRNGYAKYLNAYIKKEISLETSLKYYSLGGVPNIFATIQESRYDIGANSDIIFFECCVNDRHAIETDHYSLELAEKALEGFVRKVNKSNPNCLIVILIFGINLDNFYNTHCYLSELYQKTGYHYGLPTINITKLLSNTYNLEYVKSLYNDKDHAHYSRPQGVQIVSQTIVNELKRLGTINNLQTIKTSLKKKDKQLKIFPTYRDNLEELAFLESFENGNYFFKPPKISVYQNTVFREKNFTIYQGNLLKFLLKGKLMAIFIKSDLNDGFITIEFNKQRIVTSSYSSWVNNIKPQNVINLITLPWRRFLTSQDFAIASICLCPEYPNDFELDFNKAVPTKKDPKKWKLSIIGIAYIGEIKPLN
ncbi:hypothetical protein [Pleurocapsa sp. FMAR1]|uniref:hypothetical protein n=1 Tax=Pleurocapsa sp. FMAR1 TaxID=3040204 RepID=UPI0029C742CC|nr:hypothetical protein [Pleurocapsa sp. FMAR1]